MKYFFKNLYSQSEVEAIFLACKTWEECEKVVNEFKWLVDNRLQIRTQHLYDVSTVTLNTLIKRR